VFTAQSLKSWIDELKFVSCTVHTRLNKSSVSEMVLSTTVFHEPQCCDTQYVKLQNKKHVCVHHYFVICDTEILLSGNNFYGNCIIILELNWFINNFLKMFMTV
jgi:hypothetical protein